MVTPEIKKTNKLTNGEVLELFHNLNDIKGLKGRSVLLAVLKTKASLKPIAKAFSHSAMVPKPEKFSEYENEIKKAVSAARERLVKEDPGHPALVKVDSGIFELRADSVEAQEIAISMKNKYSEVIEEYTKAIKEYNQFLDKECTENYTITKFPLCEAPEEQQAFEAIFPLIED